MAATTTRKTRPTPTPPPAAPEPAPEAFLNADGHVVFILGGTEHSSVRTLESLYASVGFQRRLVKMMASGSELAGAEMAFHILESLFSAEAIEALDDVSSESALWTQLNEVVQAQLGN